LDQDKEATLFWNSYVEKVLSILKELEKTFLNSEDIQLNQEQLSLKYSARKAAILLTPIVGQHPPLPLPTISFVFTLLDTVTKYLRSIKAVCACVYM